MSTPAHAHLLDRLIGASLPPLDSTEAIARFEAQAPWAERVAAQSTYQALQLGAAAHPDAPALVFLAHADPDETPRVMSHAQLIARITQAANLFHQLGVGAGDVVSLLLPLLPQAFVALFGAQAVGVANPVNPMLSAAQLAEILQAAGTRVLVTLGPAEGSDIWQKVQSIRQRLPLLKAVLVVDGGGQADISTDTSADTSADTAANTAADDFDARLDAQPASHLLSGRMPRADDIAGYFHTGGTTGTPKLVRHSHANQVYQAWGLRLTGLALPGRAILFGLPLFHVGGALTQSLSALSNGGHLVVLTAAGWRDPRSVRNVWRLVQRWRPTVLSGVPTVLAGALQVPVGDADISSLQVATAGGSAIPVAVVKAYEAMGLAVLQVYGMTETASVHCMSYPQMPRLAGSTGRPLPYSRVRVLRIDADGHYLSDCGIDEIGVVAMAGPGIFGGYLMDKHNLGAFVEPGWVNSGDLGRLDAQGELWLTGRAKDLIIRGGHNIDPAPLEELLYQHPAVALAALVGQPDAHAGELPVAYVQRKAGVEASAASAAALIAYLRERSPERAAVPVALYFIDAMPLTAVGKIFKPTLRQDAVLRAARGLLDELAGPGCEIGLQLRPDALHGQVLSVALSGGDAGQRQRIAQAVQARLAPLALQHEISGA